MYTQALKQFLLKDGPIDRCTPKRNGPKMVFIIPSARREVELRDEKVAGYLARERAARRPHLPGALVGKNGPRAADADHASDEMSREPEHALVKTGCRFFPTRSSRSTRLFALRSFYRSRARSAQAWPALIGWDTTHSLIWRAAKRTGS